MKKKNNSGYAWDPRYKPNPNGKFCDTCEALGLIGIGPTARMHCWNFDPQRPVFETTDDKGENWDYKSACEQYVAKENKE